MQKVFYLVMTLIAMANLVSYGILYREPLMLITGTPGYCFLIAGQVFAFVYFYKHLKEWSEKDDERVDAQWR